MTDFTSQKKYLNAAVGAAVLFFLLAVVLGILYFQANRKSDRIDAQNTEIEQLKAELEKDYYQALSDLEEMRGSNTELNALIEKQKEDLGSQKAQIDRLLRDNRNLNTARAQLKDLNAKAQQYLAEINQLRQENEQLIATNSQLAEVNEQLESSLTQTREEAEALNAAKARLENQKAQLQQTTEQLSKKVNIASVVKVDALEVTGLKVRSNGSTTPKKVAKNIDQIEVCFNTTANEVAPVGNELFFIRIINPDGVTLSIETLGSGQFKNNATGDPMLYTRTAEIPYEKDAQQVCSLWAPGQTFMEGTYQVEVYNKGYLAGSTSFELR